MLVLVPAPGFQPRISFHPCLKPICNTSLQRPRHPVWPFSLSLIPASQPTLNPQAPPSGWRYKLVNLTFQPPRSRNCQTHTHPPPTEASPGKPVNPPLPAGPSSLPGRLQGTSACAHLLTSATQTAGRRPKSGPTSAREPITVPCPAQGERREGGLRHRRMRRMDAGGRQLAPAVAEVTGSGPASGSYLCCRCRAVLGRVGR